MRARFLAYRDVRSENLRSPLANPQDRMSEGRGSGVPFPLVTSLWARTAPQERREQRSWPAGRRAGCPESREVTRRPDGRRNPRRMRATRS